MSLTKAEIRNKALQRRDLIDEERRRAFASRLADVGPRLVLDFAPPGKSLIVSLFSSIGSEPDVASLATALHSADVPLALPVDWSHGSPLIYRRWNPGDPLAPGPLGIGEPLQDAPECEPDVLFIPVLAFDRMGHRIGYGAGNVDQTLRRLRSRKPVQVIGVAYRDQEELFISADPHDEQLDIILTDRDVLLCRD